MAASRPWTGLLRGVQEFLGGSFTRRRARPRRASREQLSWRPEFEALEQRCVLAASVSVSNGNLLVLGEPTGSIANNITVANIVVGSSSYVYITDNSVVIASNSINPIVTQSVASLTVNGYGGNDRIDLSSVSVATFPSLGLVLVYGGDGNDTIYGSSFADDLRGEAGNDVIVGWPGADVIAGGSGDDTLYGDYSSNQGAIFHDILSGEAGADWLFGDQGNDNLYGGADNDVLIGNDGNNTLWGGPGNDRFTYQYSGGSPNLTDTIQENVDEGVDSLDFANFAATVNPGFRLDSPDSQVVAAGVLTLAMPGLNVERVDGTPLTATATGRSVVKLGEVYTLNLSVAGLGAPDVNGWSINWGDGTGIQAISGNPSLVTHTFANSTTNSIVATALRAGTGYAATPLTVTAYESAVLVIAVPAGAQQVRLVRNGDLSEVYLNNGAVPSQVFSSSSVDRLDIGLAGGNDTITVDLSGGDPVPGGFIYLDGGATPGSVLRVINGAQSRGISVQLPNAIGVAVEVSESVLRFATNPVLPSTEAALVSYVRQMTLSNGRVIIPAGGTEVAVGVLNVNGNANSVDVGGQSLLRLRTFDGEANPIFAIAVDAKLVKEGPGIFLVAVPQQHGTRAQYHALGGVTNLNTNAGGPNLPIKNLNVRASNSGTRINLRSVQHWQSAIIDTGAVIRLADDLGRQLWVNGLQIDLDETSGPSQLDLGNGMLLWSYTNQPNPSTIVRQLLQPNQWSVGGAYPNKAGIRSSTVGFEKTQISPFASLSWIDNPTTPIFRSITASNRLDTAGSDSNLYGSVIVNYDATGNANLTSLSTDTQLVNAADTSAIGTAGAAGAWQNGDFNYDGLVDATGAGTHHHTGLNNQVYANRVPGLLAQSLPAANPGDVVRFTIDAIDATVKLLNGTANNLTFMIQSATGGISPQIDATTGDVTCILPSNISSGTKSITVRASQSITNFADRTYNFDVNGSNLTVPSFTTPTVVGTTPTSGLLQIGYTVQNAPIGPFNVGIYATPDGSGTATRLMTYRVSNPADLSVGVRTVTFRADFADWSGDYFLSAKLDDENEIGESSETDNTASFSGRVFVALDGTVHVQGATSGDDFVTLGGDTAAPTVTIGGETYVLAPDVPITAVSARLHGGNDTWNDQLNYGNAILPVRLFTGTGDDTITVAGRDSFVDAGAGTDSVTVAGTAGDDTVEISTAGIHQNGGPGIRFANGETVTVSTGAGDDRIRYLGRPTGISKVEIDAGAQSTADRLDLSAFSQAGLLPSSSELRVSQIEDVDLSHNGIAAIDASLFGFLASTAGIQRLDLRYNKLDLADPNELNYFQQTGVFPNLQKLWLYGNRDARLGVADSDPEPDLYGIRGKLLRVDLAPVGIEKAEAFWNIAQTATANEVTVLSALSKSLHYLPLAIYEYVLNNFEYQVYAGRMKSPLAVIQTKAGNDWDLSNLLIELLKANGVVAASNLGFSGNVTTGSAYTYIAVDAARAWLGTTPAAVLADDPLTQAISATNHGLIINDGSILNGYAIDQVWVTANFGGAWKPMNPSFKRTDLSSLISDYLPALNQQLGTSYPNFAELLAEQVPPNPGAPAELSLLDPRINHVDSYFQIVDDKFRQDTIYEWYEDRVSRWLAQYAPGLTLADLQHKGTIHSREIASLSDAWPIELQFYVNGVVSELDAVSGNSTVIRPTFTAGATDHHRIRLMMNKVVGATKEALWNTAVTLNASDISLSSAVVYVTNGRPRLYLDGSSIATSVDKPGASVVNASDLMELTIEELLPSASSDTSGIKSYVRSGDQVLAVAIEANQLTDRRLFDIRGTLSQKAADLIIAADTAPLSTTAINVLTPSDVGTVLTLAGSTYFRRVDESQAAMDGLFRMIPRRRLIQTGLISSSSTLTKADVHRDLQFPAILPGLFVDIREGFVDSNSRDPKNNGAVNKAAQARKVIVWNNSSSAEHILWEELANSYGMSTMRSFQVARQMAAAGIPNPVDVVDGSQWSAWKANKLNPQIIATVDQMMTSATPPQRLIIPQKLTNALGWSGVGFVADYANSTAWIIVKSDGTQGNGGHVVPGGTKAVPDVPPAPKSWQPVVNDPVNIATGAVNDDIVDIQLPAIGLPLTFSRHYDSNASGTGELGKGWYHNYSDRLLKVTGSPETLTAPGAPATMNLRWFDSMGRQFDIAFNGSNYIGARPAELDGAFFYGSGKYVYRDRSGAIRRFNENGTLDSISDEHGNTLQMGYVNSRLASVTSIPVVGAIEGGSQAVYSTLNISYDGAGRLSQVSEGPAAAGRVWKYTVSPSGSEAVLIRVESPAIEVNGSLQPVVVGYTYHTGAGVSPLVINKLKSIIHPDGNSTKYEYYSNGRALSSTDPEGNVQRFHFDLYRNRTYAFDERMNATVYKYSPGKGNLIQVQHPDRSRETYEWNETKQRLNARTDVGNITTTFSYDADPTPAIFDDPFDEVWQVDLQKTTGYTNGVPNRTTLTVTENGASVNLSTKYAYLRVLDGNNLIVYSKLAQETRPAPSGVFRATTYRYDLSSPNNPLLVKIVESDLRSTFFSRLANGLVVNEKQRSWQSGTSNATVTADDLGRPLMSEVSYAYNNAGQPTTVTSLVGFNDAVISEKTTYDARGFVTSTSDGRDTVSFDTTVNYVVDNLGRRTATTLPATKDASGVLTVLNAATSIARYDAFGNVVLNRDPLGRATYATFDKRQKQTRTVAADGSVITRQYDPVGNVIAQTDALGRVTRMLYDSRNRLTEIILPDGSSTVRRYDGRGNVVSTLERMNPAGYVGAPQNALLVRETKQVYDERGLLIKRILPDPDGDPSQGDPSPVTDFRYDAAGNLTVELDPRGTASSDVNADGVVNAADAAAITTFLGGAASKAPLNTSVTVGPYYDVDRNGVVNSADSGLVTSVVTGNSGLTLTSGTVFTYDTLNRVASRTDPNYLRERLAGTSAAVWQYHYDQPHTEAPGLNRLDRIIDPLNRVTETEHDFRGRVRIAIRRDSTNTIVRKSAFGYDASDNLIAAVEPRGYEAGNSTSSFTTTTVFDSRSQRILTDRPDTTLDGATLTHQSAARYDQAGNLVETSEVAYAGGPATTAKSVTRYDVRNRPIETRRFLDSVQFVSSQIRYDDAGNIVATVDPLGRVSQVEYDDRNRPVLSIDPLGNRVRSAYTTSGKLRSSTDARGNASTTLYDRLDRPFAEIGRDPDGPGALSAPITYRYYDGVGNLIRTVIPAPGSSTYSVDPIATLSAAAVTTLLVDRQGRVLERTDPDPDLTNSVVPWMYSATAGANGSLASPVNKFVYNAVGNLVQEIDPRAGVTDYAFDSLNRLISKTLPDNDLVPAVSDGPDGRPIWQYAYDAAGNPTSTTDPVNRKTIHSYDSLNQRLQSAMFAAGAGTPSSTRKFNYDNRGNQVVVVDPRGVALASEAAYTTRTQFDLLDRPTQLDRPDTVDASGTQLHVSKSSYDAAGNSVSSTDEIGRRTEYRFDPLNRQTSMKLPSLAGQPRGGWTVYDANSNVVASVDALGSVSRGTYDNLDRQTVSTDALGRNTTTTFDAAGHTLTMIDPRGVKNEYLYDRLGRQTDERVNTGPGVNDFDARKYEFDVASNVVKQTDRDGRITRWTHDLASRPVKEEWSTTASPATITNTINSSYTLAGQLKQTGDTGSTVSFTYDYAGRKATEASSGPGQPTVTLTSSYDVAGNRIMFRDNASADNDRSFTYDAAGRMTAMNVVQRDGIALNENPLTLSWTDDDQLAGISRRQGASAAVPGPSTRYTYERATGRLSSIVHAQAVGTSSTSIPWTRTVDEFAYGYDRDDRIVSLAGLLDPPATYGYDKTDQLTSADLAGMSFDESYAYDVNGNRNQSTYGTTTAAYDPGNQYTQNRYAWDDSWGVRYNNTYDKEGHLTQRTLASNPNINFLYAWDHRDRLMQVQEKNGAAVTKQTDFAYDALDRRIKKTHDPDGAGMQAATTEKYVHDGDDLYLQFNSANAVQHRYLHGPLVDQILADEDFTSSFKYRWPLSDHEQSVRDIVDGSTNALLNHKRYDSFGNIRSETNTSAAADVIFGYTGREFDAETGLQYNRARYYDPRLGRFISQDPSGFAGGDVNLYRYAGNNPLNATDPDGLATRLLGNVATAAGNAFGSALNWLNQSTTASTASAGLATWNSVASTATAVGASILNATLPGASIFRATAGAGIGAAVASQATGLFDWMDPQPVKIGGAREIFSAKGTTPEQRDEGNAHYDRIIKGHNSTLDSDRVKLGSNAAKGMYGFLETAVATPFTAIGENMRSTLQLFYDPATVMQNYVASTQATVETVATFAMAPGATYKNLSAEDRGRFWGGLATLASGVAMARQIGGGSGSAGQKSVQSTAARADNVANAASAVTYPAIRTMTGEGGSVRIFNSFSQLKRGLGSPGEGMVWHHIVEQRDRNVRRFGVPAIHNTQNVVGVDITVNKEVNRYYSSIKPFTKGKTVREWLNTQPYNVHSELGEKVLQAIQNGKPLP